MAVLPQQATFAVKRNTNAWDGPAVDCDEAGAGFEPHAPGALVPPGREYQEDPTVHGAAGRLKFDPANHLPEFSFDAGCRYAGALNKFIAGWFGSEATSSITEGTVQVGTKHKLTVEDQLGDHFTFVADWPSTDLLEIDHFKVDEISLSWSAGERAVWSISCMGRRWHNDSSINTGVSSVTVTTPRDYALSDQLVFQAASQSGSLTAVSISEFTITLSRNLDTTVTTGAAPYQDEPFAPAPGWTGTIAFTIARWSATTYQDAHDAGTLMKAKLAFTGALLSGASTETLGIEVYLPQFQITSYDPSDEGTVGEQIEGELSIADSAPSEMDSNTGPAVYFDNNDSTGYLA